VLGQLAAEPMARSIRLRQRQQDALDQPEQAPDPDLLAVVTFGAGKAAFALAVVFQRLAEHPNGHVLVVADGR
jgi:hypothetical protein